MGWHFEIYESPGSNHYIIANRHTANYNRVCAHYNVVAYDGDTLTLTVGTANQGSLCDTEILSNFCSWIYYDTTEM